MYSCVSYLGVTVSIVSDSFIVGSSAQLTCSSDLDEAVLIEWVSETGQVASTTGTMLTLSIDLVNDSLHETEFTCFVTRVSRHGTSTANGTFIITVTGVCSRCMMRELRVK